MPININNIVNALQVQANNVTNATDAVQMIKILKAIKDAGVDLISVVDISGIDGLVDALNAKVDLSDYNTDVQDIQNALDNRYTKAETDSAISAATPTFATILEKPTTISGYGITDAYTKTEVNSAISAATPTFATILEKPTTVSGYGITDAYTKTETDTNISGAINNLVNGAPAALDTLKELADAINDDSSFASSVTTSLSTKVDKTITVNGHALSGNVTVSKSDVGLGNVSNTDTTTTANITDSTNKRFVSDAQITLLGNTSGTNTGDETLSTIKTKLGITTLSGSNTGDQTITLTGDITGSGTGSFSTTLANSGVTAGTYTKVTVDAKGRTTSGTTLSSADLPTYTGTITSSQVTTALGFTPYNSTNPSGYLTSVPAATSTTYGGVKVSLSGTTLTFTV